MTDQGRPVRLLAISGSLRDGSSNTAVLDAVRLLAPPGVTVVPYDGLAGLPAFNPDLDREGVRLPDAASDLRDQVAEADALLVCSPEYAHGIPGALKNLLDWLVGSVEFPGKAVTLLAASERSHRAQAQLAEVLRTMSARLAPDAAVPVALPGRDTSAEQIAADPRLAAVLTDALRTLLGAIGSPSRAGTARPEDRAAPPGTPDAGA